jgi:hypothetical protein
VSDKPETDERGMVLKSEFTPDYTGMATEPFSDEARKILAETPNHDEVELKPDGICFMPGVWYRRQLTRAFGAGGWGLRPTAPVRTVGNAVEWTGALYCLGRWVAEAVGGQPTSEWMSHADSIQGAKTDCLSKCCGHGLAMASELWDKTWREAWMAEYTTKEWKDGKDGKKGKWVFSLKEKRAPRAANLMGPPAEPAPDTGEVASREVCDQIVAEMKRLGLKGPSAKAFLEKYGAGRVTSLTALRAAEALQALLAEPS